VILDLLEEATGDGARQSKACEVLGLNRRTAGRWRAAGGGEDGRQGPRAAPANKLTEKERSRVLETVNSPEYRDLPPKQIVPRLADEGKYLASESTVYRLLREEGLSAHRERSRPPVHSRPREHAATGPNQVWSWDITYLPSVVRGLFFYLYMVEDVWSRKIVGWEIHCEESMDLAARLISRTCAELGVDPDGLVLHADNGGPMKGATMLATLQRLGVVTSFSRPHVSDDNPYSEALFRTLKYRPEYPRGPFETLEAARAWVAGFVTWYNTEHLHSAIRFVTPDDRHYGCEDAILRHRKLVYERARRRNPRRWSGATRDWNPVGTVVLNPERHVDQAAAR
jgi:transposase InsO family protein